MAEEVAGEDVEVKEEEVEEGEKKRFNPALSLIVIGTIIVIASVTLAFLVFLNFKAQDALTLVFIKDRENLIFSLPWTGAIIQLLSSLVFIIAGAKLIDRGINLFGE